MPQVLINLKIPSLSVKSPDDSAPRRVDNSTVRFMKAVDLAAIPKAGDVLEMTAGVLVAPFRCTVKMAEWDERENMFVVACSWAKTSIPEADYRALVGSPDWAAKPLL